MISKCAISIVTRIPPTGTAQITAATGRRLGGHVGGGEADDAQKGCDRKGGEQILQAAFAGGARRAQMHDRDHHEQERIERARQPVMQLGMEFLGIALVVPVALVRMDQLGEEALAGLVFPVLAVLRAELGQVEQIAVEGDDVHVLGLAVLALHMAGVHDEIGLGVALFDDLGPLGEIGHDLVLIALVMDHQTEQVAIGCASGDVQRQPLLGRREFAGLQHLRNQVGAHLDGIVTQCAHRLRQHIGVDRQQAREHQEGEHQIGFGHPPDIGARGREHDQLGIAAQPVEGVQARDQQRDRRHHRDQIGHGERGDGEEHQHALPLVRHQRDLAQRGRHPDDQRQRDQDHRQG